MIRLLLVVILSLCSTQISAHGIVQGTLIKTPHGMVAVERLNVGDVVICFDTQYGTWNEQPILQITHELRDSFLEMTVEGESFGVSPDQTLYIPCQNRWIKACAMQAGTTLLSAHIGLIAVDSTRIIQKPVTLYKVAVNTHHTYCICPHAVLAHNFAIEIPILTWVFGEGIIWLGGATVATIASALGLSFAKKGIKKFGQSVGADVNIDDTAKLDESNSKNDGDDNNNRKYAKQLTPERRKELDRIAKEMGFKETTDYKFHPHGEKVYKRGNTYITPDRDGHRGGDWKKMDKHGGRWGTYNKDLSIKIGS